MTDEPPQTPLSLPLLTVKTVIVHTITYFVAGFLAYTLGGYEKTFSQPPLSYLMRPTSDPVVMAGPLFQPVRGVIFALALYLPAQRRVRKTSWVADPLVAPACSRRSIDVRTESGLCGRSDLHDHSTDVADPGTVGGPSAITPVFSPALLLGQSPRKALAQLDAGHCIFDCDDPSSAGASRRATGHRHQLIAHIRGYTGHYAGRSFRSSSIEHSLRFEGDSQGGHSNTNTTRA